MIILIDIPGKPLPFKSPRVFSRISFNPLYKEKEQTQHEIRKQYAGEPLSCTISCDIIFYFQMPISFSKKKKIEAIAGEILPIAKFDLDNLCKYYLDCLKTIVIVDDGLIVDLRARKRYSTQSHTVIQIQEHKC